MAFWSKWFGTSEAAADKALQSEEYKGFVIEAVPFKEGGQWQLAGFVRKDGKEHRFVRADKFTDKDECAAIAISKGKLIVDQQGERVFG
jgi:hypothetical protein